MTNNLIGSYRVVRICAVQLEGRCRLSYLLDVSMVKSAKGWLQYIHLRFLHSSQWHQLLSRRQPSKLECEWTSMQAKSEFLVWVFSTTTLPAKPSTQAPGCRSDNQVYSTYVGVLEWADRQSGLNAPTFQVIYTVDAFLGILNDL